MKPAWPIENWPVKPLTRLRLDREDDVDPAQRPTIVQIVGVQERDRGASRTAASAATPSAARASCFTPHTFSGASAAEQTRRAHEQDHDQDHERDRVAVGRRDVADDQHLRRCPMQEPPAIAPGMLPMPPSTAATNALSPGMMPISGSILGFDSPTSTPAARGQHRAEHEGERDRCGRPRCPSEPPPSWLYDTARIALPTRVWNTMNCRPSISATDTARTMICRFVIATPLPGESSRDSSELREELRVGAEEQYAAVLEQQRDADRGDERRRGASERAQRPVGEALDHAARARRTRPSTARAARRAPLPSEDPRADARRSARRSRRRTRPACTRRRGRS